MESREASAQAPTALTALLAELRNAQGAGGRHESVDARAGRMYKLIESNADSLTMTLRLMMSDGEPLTYWLNNALLGMRYNHDTQRDEMGAAPPLHPQIRLQSLRTKCPQCERNKCGRQGKFHDIVYKTNIFHGSGSDRNLAVAMGGSADVHAQCKVDPDTGLFSLPPLEAIKALRQWGEHALRATRRWTDRVNKKGDRWLIREVRHHELYGNATLGGAVEESVKPMVLV